MRGFLSFLGAFVIAGGLAFGVSVMDASEAESARYAQVVDNSTPGRFSAPAGEWGFSSYSAARYGHNYRFSTPSLNARPALYKVRIPARANYTIFARWPADPGYNGRARYGIRTTSGLKWKVVNQRENGGRWVKLGVYNMRAGDNFSVQVSRITRAKGYVVADAIRVERGNVATPGGNAASPPAGGGGDTGGGGAKVTGLQVANQARSWLGVPYRYGGTTRQGVDCSGFTYALYRSLGINLPRVASAQFHQGPGTKVSSASRQRGFLIFGNTGRQSGIQHVGVLMGNGKMVHAPYPGTVVREEAVGGWYNVIGVKRIVPAA
ncbi:MAG: NlpC/P60 family protein [Rubrobacteraceae bacterium]